MSQQVSFVVDERTLKAIEKLKETFGVTSNAAVIRKALAFSSVAAETASSDHAVTLIDRDDTRVKITLAG